MPHDTADFRGCNSHFCQVSAWRESECDSINEALVQQVIKAQRLQLVAEQALRRQSEALAFAVHELRSPLMPILTVSQLLAKGIGADNLTKLASVLDRQVRQMKRLVDDLFDSSRVATGKMHLKRSSIDLVQIFGDVMDVCLPSMHARAQHFTAHIPDGPLMVEGDEVRLMQVFTNLLQNAVKYTPREGSIMLTCTVAARDEATDEVVVTIVDNGIGITPNALPMIFELFVQEPHAIGFSPDGLGIGLTLVHKLVQAHGGTVSATSAGTGFGSEFVVRLPLMPIALRSLPTQAFKVTSRPFPTRVSDLSDSATSPVSAT